MTARSALPYRYLLDTNIVSDLVRNPQGAVTRRIARIGEDKVCTSIIVACELRYGAEKKGSARQTLVTNNLDEFRRVGKLKLANWL